MSDNELRDLLHRVVPEPPDLDPAGSIKLARRWRSRRRTGLVAGVVVLVAGVLVTVSAVGGSNAPKAPPPGPAASGPTTTGPTTTAPASTGSVAFTEPYDANICPSESERAVTRSVDLTNVVAIVQCGVASGNGQTSGPLTPEAYIDDMSRFGRLVADAYDLQDMDCELGRYVTSNHLVFRYADGTATTVNAAPCDTVQVAGEPVRAVQLEAIYLDALGQQRDRLDYTREAAPPTCDDQVTRTPIVPGRESFVAAVACSSDGTEVRRLDAALLEGLQRAWLAKDPTFDEGFCLGSPDRDYGYVLATTSRGDTARLDESQCGGRTPGIGSYLVLEPHELHVNLADLGLT